MEEIKQPSQLSQQSFLHSSAITDTSIGLKRISRKTDQSSATRRSLSRNSSSKSNEKVSCSSFFVKMSTLQKIADENSTTAARSSILRRESYIHEKKRSPTPVPGKLVRRRTNEQEARKEDVEIQNELLIAELQSRLDEECKKVRIFQKKALLLEKQLKFKVVKIQDLQTSVERFLLKEKQLMARLKDVQSQNHCEQTIIEPKSRLDRFKNSIKQNRFVEIQAQNNRLRIENEELKQKIVTLEKECRQSQQQCTSLQSQLLAMQHRIGQEKKEIVSSPRNNNFQDMLLSREEYNKKLEARVSKLQIQLNYMNRKKMEQIQQWKNKKNKEVIRARERLSSIHKQFIQLRIENQVLRSGLKRQDVNLSRSSLITTTHSWSSREDVIELSLSPEHLEH